MAAKSNEKILCGAALVLLLASIGWSVSKSFGIKRQNAAPKPSEQVAAYEPAAINQFQVNNTEWSKAPAQTRGPLWVYDVFTPPEIYYDAKTKQFTVSPPAGNQPEAPFGLDVVEIKEDVFRLQLVGYTGSLGNYKGTFSNMVSGRALVGYPGKKIEDLGLTIRSFEVKRNEVKQATDKDVTQSARTTIITFEAVAQVVDDKTGEVNDLSNLHRLVKGTAIAMIKPTGSTTAVPYKAGAKFTVGDVTYTIQSVSFETNEVVILKEGASLPEPITKTLSVPAPVTPDTEGAPAAP